MPADVTRLHELVEQYTQELHAYVEAAHAIGVELGDIDEVQDDPRMEVVERKLSSTGRELNDAFMSDLGIPAPVDALYSQDAAQDEEGDLEGAQERCLLMEIDIAPESPSSAAAIGLLEDAGSALSDELSRLGYDVRSWTVGHRVSFE